MWQRLHCRVTGVEAPILLPRRPIQTSGLSSLLWGSLIQRSCGGSHVFLSTCMWGCGRRPHSSPRLSSSGCLSGFRIGISGTTPCMRSCERDSGRRWSDGCAMSCERHEKRPSLGPSRMGAIQIETGCWSLRPIAPTGSTRRLGTSWSIVCGPPRHGRRSRQPEKETGTTRPTVWYPSTPDKELEGEPSASEVFLWTHCRKTRDADGNVVYGEFVTPKSRDTYEMFEKAMEEKYPNPLTRPLHDQELWELIVPRKKGRIYGFGVAQDPEFAMTGTPSTPIIGHSYYGSSSSEEQLRAK